MFTLALIIWAFRVEAKPSRTVLAFCWLSDLAIAGAALYFLASGISFMQHSFGLDTDICYATGEGCINR